MPWTIVGGMIAYRKSWFEEVGVDQVPRHLGEISRGRQEAQGQGSADRPDARPHLRRRADVHLSLPVVVGRQGGRGDGKSGHQQQGDRRVGQVHDRASGRTRTTRAASPGTTPTTTAPSSRRRSAATLNGASIYIEVAAQARQVHDREGRASSRPTSCTRRCRRGRPASSRCTPTTRTRCRSYSKNQKAAKDFLKWVHSKAVYEKWFVSQKGFATPPTAEWEKHKVWDEDPVMLPYKVAGRLGRTPGYAGPAERQVGRGALQVHHHRHVREGRAGHAGRGGRQVGRGRAQEGLRLRLCRGSSPSPAARGDDGRRYRPRRITHGGQRGHDHVGRSPAAATAAAARGRALARLRAARADHGAARHVHRLPVRARHHAVGDQLARGRARRLRRASPISTRSGTTRSSAPPSTTPSSIRASPRSSSWRSGLWLAMLLNRNFKGKAFTRAFILLPFIIPTVLSTFAWKWMFDPDLQRPQLAALSSRR